MSERVRFHLPAAVLLVTIISGFATCAPTVVVESPADGSVHLSRTVDFSGSAAGTDLTWFNGTKTDFDAATKDRVAVNPDGNVTLVHGFSDNFDDNVLDTNDWNVLNQRGGIYATVENKALKLSGTSISGSSWGAGVWVKCLKTADVLSKATLKTFSGSGYYSCGLFLWQDDRNYIGVGQQIETDVYGSGIQLMISYKYQGSGSYYSEGVITNPNGHAYSIVYRPSASKADVYQDQNLITTKSIVLTNPCVLFTCGARRYGDKLDAVWDDVDTGYRSPGTLTSNVFDAKGNPPMLLWGDWNATVGPMTDLTIEVRSSASPDMNGASLWTKVSKATGTGLPLISRYVQYRATLISMDAQATPSFRNVSLEYRIPVVSVEVRVGGAGPWLVAPGTTTWTARLDLPENETTVWVRVTDSAGVTNMTSIRVLVDTTRPAGTVVIDDGATYATSRTVNLTLDAHDAFGVDAMMVSGRMDFTDANWRSYEGRITWPLPLGDGQKVVYAKFMDKNGLFSDVSSDTIVLDTMAPVGFIDVNGGELYTNETVIDVQLYATDLSGVEGMQLSESPTFEGAVWVPYTQTFRFQLQAVDGAKTIYARFRDVVGHVSTAVNDTLVLDRVAPVLSLTLNGGERFTNSRLALVTLTLTHNGPVEWMKVSGDPLLEDVSEEPFRQTLELTLTGEDGLTYVYARAWDMAGNIGPIASASITIDTRPPSIRLTINDDDTYTNTTLVTLSVVALEEDVLRDLEVDASPLFTGATRMPFVGSLSWVLTGGDGTNMLYARATDMAGNVGLTVTDSIILDTTPPALAITVDWGVKCTASRNVTVALVASDANGVVTMMVWEGVLTQGGPPTMFRDSTAWTLSTGDGAKVLQARVADRAGNWCPAANATIALDMTAPDSAVTATASKGSTSIIVSWNGTDAPSGVRRFEVQYQEDDGLWTDWLNVTAASNTTFEGSWGHTYRFRVRATDNVGNVGPYTESAEPVELQERSVFLVPAFIWLIIIVIVATAIVVTVVYYARWRRRGEQGP